MGKIKNDKLVEVIDAGGTVLDDASGLIPLHITTRQELYDAEFMNMTEATEHYLFDPRGLNKFEMTRQCLFDIHKKMFYRIWNWAGKKRKSNKNIGVPAYKIDEELAKFIGDYDFWIKENLKLIEIIAKVHHRLVWIHPFEGGNGRWSRLITNIVYFKETKKILQWPEDELQLKKRSPFREKYLEALTRADNGDYKDLIELHLCLI